MYGCIVRDFSQERVPMASGSELLVLSADNIISMQKITITIPSRKYSTKK